MFLQGGEYGTDEEEDEDEEASPPYPSAIEVFDLAENEDMSPLETDPEKLAHKYKEVRCEFIRLEHFNLVSSDVVNTNICFCCCFFYRKAPNKTCCDPGWDPAAEKKGEAENEHIILKVVLHLNQK